MKKLILLCLALSVINSLMVAQETKKISLDFHQDRFSLEYNKRNECFIYTECVDYIYDEDTSLPCIPYMMVNVAVPANYNYASHEIEASQSIVEEDIVLSKNPQVLPTNYVGLIEDDKPAEYAGELYPDKQVAIIGSSIVGNWKILTFKVSPFEYNAPTKTLCFSNHITLDIRLKKSIDKSEALKLNEENLSMLRRSVVNPDDITTNNNEADTTQVLSPSHKVDYLIITSPSLASAFQPLMVWKNTKGVRTEIITTDEITNNYEGNSVTLKIKQCLYDYYVNHELKYALLGGDNTIVATQECYAYGNSNHICYDMPTDLFYACFDMEFDWNRDGDNNVGEPTDSISMFPNIYLTRVPVRRVSEVNDFVKKVLYYEKTPTQNGWNNEALMGGVQLFSPPTGVPPLSDAEAKGEILYSNHFNWSGTRKRFYDTYTDFIGAASYDVTIANIFEQFSIGYSFIDMITHGNPIEWKTESESVWDFFSSRYAMSVTSPQPSIITTNACLTNAFDNAEDPCLSESFIRYQNSNVVAYLGCSREGWGNANYYVLGTSLNYEAKFYDNLFAEGEPKNFGKLVAQAKYANRSNSLYNGTYRWVMFGLNPIGDAEMPVYTETPTPINDVSIDYIDGNLVVSTVEPDCKICVMSEEDMGASYFDVRENVQFAIFNDVDMSVSICITKQNKIPYIARQGFTYIQNEVVTGPHNIDDNFIIIGDHVTTRQSTGPVVFQGGNTVIKGDITLVSTKKSLSFFEIIEI